MAGAPVAPKGDNPAKPFGQWERSLASRYLRTKRKNGGVALISWISFGGITVAVAALIIVMSVMNGFRTELLGRMLGFNGHVMIQGPAINGPGRDALIARVRAVPGVTEAVPLVEAQGVAIGPSQLAFAIVRGMRLADVKAARLVSQNLKSGSMKGFGDGEYGGDLVLVGARLADTIGVKAGDEIALISPSGGSTAFGSAPRRKTYTVGGVFSVGVSEYDQAFIYMPLEQSQLFFGRDQAIDLVEMKLANPDKLDAIKPDIVRAAGSGAIVTDWRDRNHAFFNALQVERSVMRLILMMVVVIAAMNIISGLVMLVKNKGRDIAILRTMGAGQSAILRIFFMSGAAIGAAGTLAGLVIGSLFCIFISPIQAVVEKITGVSVFSSDVYFLNRIPARIEWSEVLLIVLWSLVAAFLCTLPPAWRASRLDPVEALRYE
jgi:lipoprotein-releasing system permease protein